MNTLLEIVNLLIKGKKQAFIGLVVGCVLSKTNIAKDTVLQCEIGQLSGNIMGLYQ